SGTGRLVRIDPRTGTISPIATLPGYARGLALTGSLAFVGLSRARETSAIGAVPIAARPERLECGVAAVELGAGRTIAFLKFHTGVDEIFDVQILPGARSPSLHGPHRDVDDQAPIWLAPPPVPIE